MKNGKCVGQSKKITDKPIIKKELKNVETIITPKIETNTKDCSSNKEINMTQNFSHSSIMNAGIPNGINNFNNNMMVYPNIMGNSWIASQMQNLQRVLFILDSPRPIFPQAIFQQYRWNY